MRSNLLVFILLLTLMMLTACVQGGRGVAPAEPVLRTSILPLTPAVQTVELHTATPEGQGAPTEAQVSPLPPQVTGEPALGGQWVEYRDPKYGFGLAIPCWWPYSPIPTQGIGGTMTIKSYDEAFFLANSTKGWWTGGDWPEGTSKLDITAWQDFDPSLTTLQAFNTTFDPASSEIASTHEVRIGENEALLVEMRNLVNTSDPNSRLYVFRPAGDTLLMASAAPDRALDSSDVQAMLASLSLSTDQLINLPQVAPAPAIIPVPEGCPVNE